MIIEPRIRISAEELDVLKRPMLDVHRALEIAGRVQNAIRSNSFNVVQYARDHVRDGEGALVDAGEIEIRTDAEGNKL